MLLDFDRVEVQIALDHAHDSKMASWPPECLGENGRINTEQACQYSYHMMLKTRNTFVPPNHFGYCCIPVYWSQMDGQHRLTALEHVRLQALLVSTLEAVASGVAFVLGFREVELLAGVAARGAFARVLPGVLVVIHSFHRASTGV